MPTLAVAACPAPGEWRDASGQRLSPDSLFEEAAGAQVVLLGERHDRMEHHRWQLHTLAALHARRPDMVIGLEMLPREAQPALDAWVAGELDEQVFLTESDWSRAWGFDADLYLPILHFARMHRVPLRALNLDRSLVSRLRDEGWDAVPLEERYRITPPAPATEAYRALLGKVFVEHPSAHYEDADIDRFVAGQQVWDRAMAAGLAEAAEEGILVVGLMGSGHLEYGHGVPHQLHNLGIADTRVLLPRESGADCTEPKDGLADAVFGIGGNDRFEPPRPLLLGVRIDTDPAGVRIESVMPESVAAEAGLEAADIVTSAAGVAVRVPGDLVTIIRRQQPGHVLPLTVLRDGEQREILVRFPPDQE
ncbi:MAG: ChaN family lipoprotein [Thioalkalivibrio sp.]|nr:ChaN family lipoprotein [Thioalkalivibrio sp.]